MAHKRIIVLAHKLQVERERASERREVQPDMPVSINLSMAAPEVAYVSDTDKVSSSQQLNTNAAISPPNGLSRLRADE